MTYNFSDVHPAAPVPGESGKHCDLQQPQESREIRVSRPYQNDSRSAN